jgi:hypothetical protein
MHLELHFSSIQFNLNWKKMDANWWRMYYKFVCECDLGKTFLNTQFQKDAFPCLHMGRGQPKFGLKFGSMKYYGTL